MVEEQESNMAEHRRSIIKSELIPLSSGAVWDKWTTSEGLKTFFGADNKVELVPGGAFEIYFLMDNPPGERGSEGCRILSYLPQRMLSFSWNAPPLFPDIRGGVNPTWVVVLFNTLTDESTEVEIHHLGWPNDPSWDAVFDYFNAAWERVLQSLLESC